MTDDVWSQKKQKVFELCWQNCSTASFYLHLVIDCLHILIMSCKAPNQLKKTLIVHFAIFLLRSAPMFLVWTTMKRRRGSHVFEYEPFLMIPRFAKMSLLKSRLNCVIFALRFAKMCLLKSRLNRVFFVLRFAQKFLLNSRLNRMKL